jgi:hypothetical protein
LQGSEVNAARDKLGIDAWKIAVSCRECADFRDSVIMSGNPKRKLSLMSFAKRVGFETPRDAKIAGDELTPFFHHKARQSANYY